MAKAKRRAEMGSYLGPAATEVEEKGQSEQ